MEIIALIPGLIAALVALAKSARVAFLNVYLPVLLLLPDYYRWIAPGLPDPTFSMAAIFPIGVAFFIFEARSWRFSLMDALVLGYTGCQSYSEYLNARFADAQNLTFEMLTWVFLPYALAKGLIEPNGLRVAFAKRFVWLLFLISIISVYEFKMAATPWRQMMDNWFPGQGTGWITTFRWGFTRIAGPYGHAILAGVILVIGYRVQRWLEWSKAWEPQFKHFNFFKISKAQIITFGLAGGVLMTMVRGPWLAAALAVVITSIGKRAHKKLFAALTVLFFVVSYGPARAAFDAYTEPGRSGATTVAQESAAYRRELLDKYTVIVYKRPDYGWGRNGWPRVDGMPSIDNFYLLTALMHGLPALYLLIGIFVWPMARLLWRGVYEPSQGPPGSCLAFTLLGIIGAIALAAGTVYLGQQLVPVFFLIVGWAEGYLLQEQEAVVQQDVAVAPAPLFRFRRVMA